MWYTYWCRLSGTEFSSVKRTIIAGSEAAYQGADESAKLAVIELAVVALGRLAVRGPNTHLSVQDRVELNQTLFECLEVLNNEKDTYGG